MNQKYVDDFSDDDKIQTELNLWNKEERKVLIGVVVREELGNFGPQIVVESNDEEIVLPSLTALKTKLSEAQVGDKIKVVYLGKVTSKKSGKVYDDFDVFIKKPIKG